MSESEFLVELEKFEPIIKAECHKEEILGMTWEDLAQEIRLRLWLKKDKFDKSKSSFKTWANLLMINCLKNLLRDSKTKKALYLNNASDIDNKIEEEALDL